MAREGTLIVGDVHGCADELEMLWEISQAKKLFFVGDLFTKGPDPSGVWAIIQGSSAKSVLGNHDFRLLEWVSGKRSQDARAARVCERLSADPSWLTWLEQCPLTCTIGPFTLVHASLHPSGETEKTSQEMALFWRRWPADLPESRPWVESYQGGPVIFGHDAVQGLVDQRRDGKRWLLGLDTGCVYGGRLTGYLLEEDRLISVPAKKAYQPIAGR